MELIPLLFIMLALIVLSNLLFKIMPKVSLPLYQIFLGACFGFFQISHLFHLEAEMFMLIFVAPLLFMDSKHVQNRELWKFKKQILLMALGLVFATILIVGPVISWLIPGLPMAGAFALAAILSPTDPVSVKALFGKMNVPHDIKIMLEGESLINDASGLVVFKFALVALLTGTFSIWMVGLSFLQVAFGGILVGVGLMVIIMFITKKLIKMGVEDANVFALIQIMTPFLAFVVAETFYFSGVLAVVSAGVVVSVNHQQIITMQDARIRFISEGAWSTLLFVLNGLVFVLLGMQLPRIAQARFAYDHAAIFNDIGVVLAIYLLIMLVRFVWVFLLCNPGGDSRIKTTLLITLSGVKGAITLAAGFSIPLVIVLADGLEALFYERDLILFISGGTIIVSILVASIILPLVFPKKAAKKEEMDMSARSKLFEAAMRQIHSEMNEENKQSAYALLAYYKDLISKKSSKKIRLIKKREVDMFKLGLSAERNELLRMMETNEFNKDALISVKQTVEHKMTRINEKQFFEIAYLQLYSIYEKINHIDNDELVRIKMHTVDVAINEIRRHVTPENKAVCDAAIKYFRHILDTFLKIHACDTGNKYNHEIKKLAQKARQAEKNQISKLFESGEIDSATRTRLALDIALEEVAQLEDEFEENEV